jgi:hypothetical protein
MSDETTAAEKTVVKETIKEHVKRPSIGAPALLTTRVGAESIQRIWASLGQVWVETTDGRTKTWSPFEAAKIGLALGQMACTPGFSALERRQLIDLQSLATEAVREALRQRENPGDSATKAVQDALVGSDALMDDDEEMRRRLLKFMPMFEHLKEDEIRAAIQAFPGKSDSWYEGSLRELSDQRLRYYDQRYRRRDATATLHPDAVKQEL